MLATLVASRDARDHTEHRSGARVRRRASRHGRVRGPHRASTSGACAKTACSRRPPCSRRCCSSPTRRTRATGRCGATSARCWRRWCGDRTTPPRTAIFIRLGTARLERLARESGHDALPGGLADLGQLADHGARPDPVLPAHRHAAAAPPSRLRAAAAAADRRQSQRWGIGRLDLPDWRVYFKGGWGAGTGAVDHQVALLRRGDERIAIAVLTANNGSHAAGKRTLEGVFRRLLEGLELDQPRGC